MNDFTIFEGWPQEYVDEYLTAPSPDLYDSLSEDVFLQHSGLFPFENHEYEEVNVLDESTGLYRKEFIAHYGTPRHSGRYPWGSGKNPQRSKNWLQRADELAAQGLSQKEIAQAFGMSTGDYRAYRRNYVYEQGMKNQAQALEWHDKGMSNVAIAERLGVSEGTVRNYLDPKKKQRENRVVNVADGLEELMRSKPYLDIGEGAERQLNISADHLHAAELLLKDRGYSVISYNLPQVSNPKQYTELKVLAPPGTTRADLKEHLIEITSPQGLYFKDFGETTVPLKPIPSVDLKRIKVKYDEDGGSEKDGVIEIRPGVEDLSLGNRNYAQVRIAVDDSHYMKGMAVYGDPKTMPPGVDIIYNTHYHEGTPVLGTDSDHTVMKIMKKDPTDKTKIDAQNPFGAAFRQWDYQDKDGNTHTSPINIVNDDEDWAGWKKNLSSQFLSKQLPKVAKKQLDIRQAEMMEEFEKIKSITNPELKRQELSEFADNCDSAAVHLKAAALPRQAAFAILPINSLKDNEVYAPMYNIGEEVILVRHPHEGVFQIPRLTVNNDNKDGKRIIGTMASNAVGINSKSANQLSGADYDGDTVLVIPTKGQNLKTSKPLDGLIGYNPSDFYSRDPDDMICTGKSRDGKKGDGFNKGIKMGEASNLITDMTIKGADMSEIERAVKHSMCVIDAEKHNLDWKRSYEENGIAELRAKYQLRIDEEGKPHEGASTLISRAKGPRDVPETKPVYALSKMTPEEKERWENGEEITRETGRTYKDKKTGKIKLAMNTTENMAAVKDAYELASEGRDTVYQIERVYADYANAMKAMANEARKEMRMTGHMEVNKSAKETYDDVVGKNGSLAKKIALAELEAPKERQAQIIANSVMNAKIQADPSLKERDNADKRRKLAAKALENARDVVNGGRHVKRYRIELSDREWEAIQAGALSETQFRRVIRYSDKNELKQRAIPRRSTGMKASTRSRARMLLQNGYTVADVASMLGVSANTLRNEFSNFHDLAVGGD